MNKKLPKTVTCDNKWKVKNRYLLSYHDYTFFYPVLFHNIKLVVKFHNLETNNDFLSALDCLKTQIYTLKNSEQRFIHVRFGNSAIFIEKHYDCNYYFYYLVGIAIWKL